MGARLGSRGVRSRDDQNSDSNDSMCCVVVWYADVDGYGLSVLMFWLAKVLDVLDVDTTSYYSLFMV